MRVDDLVEQRAVRVAEQRDGALVASTCRRSAVGSRSEPAISWSSSDRVSRTEPPPARTTSGSTPAATVTPSLLAELLHVLEHLGRGDEPERIVVGARPDGADDLLGLGRREDELDVLGRLFDDLEQRVEALRRHHVRLVEDEDLVAVAGRGEHGALAQVAGVVDAVVAGRVDLDDVERSAAVAPQLDAARADTARDVGRALGAVQAAREDAGGGRLAAAARTAEEVGVIDPVGAQRGAERIGHLSLSDELAERLGTIAAIEGGDHPTRVPTASDVAAAGNRLARAPPTRPAIRPSADGMYPAQDRLLTPIRSPQPPDHGNGLAPTVPHPRRAHRGGTLPGDYGGVLARRTLVLRARKELRTPHRTPDRSTSTPGNGKANVDISVRAMQDAWRYRAALRRRVVRRDRPSPSETLWRMAPDPTPIASAAELLPVEVHVSAITAHTVPDCFADSDFTQPSIVTAELVRSVALACAQRLSSRPTVALVA